jgi:hypothetical protein
MNKSSHEGSYSFLEGKWIRGQVEGHILFGLYTRSKKLLWVLFLYLLYFCVFLVINQSGIKKDGMLLLIKNYGYHLISLALIFYFAYVSNFSQSVIFWLSTKLALAFMSFILFLLGFVNILRGYSNWLVWMILGVVWLPSFEFFPTISRHQKKLDIFRLLITGLVCTVLVKYLR